MSSAQFAASSSRGARHVLLLVFVVGDAILRYVFVQRMAVNLKQVIGCSFRRASHTGRFVAIFLDDVNAGGAVLATEETQARLGILAAELHDGAAVVAR